MKYNKVKQRLGATLQRTFEAAIGSVVLVNLYEAEKFEPFPVLVAGADYVAIGIKESAFVIPFSKIEAVLAQSDGDTRILLNTPAKQSPFKAFAAFATGISIPLDL